MSEKTLRMSLYFLAAVTALYLLITVLGRGSGGGPASDPALADALGALDADDLERIEIAGPETDDGARETLLLVQDGDDWTVNGFDADTAAVSRLLRALDDVEVASVAARNPANHERLSVDDANAWTLSFPEEDARVLLGKAGTRFRTAYARLPGADQASLIRGDLRSAAARPLLDWRNKVVLAADTGAVTAIHVVRDAQERRYERQDSTWTVDGEDADDARVRDILRELAELRATGFAPEDAERPTESAADRSVRAVDADGNEVAALWLVEQEGNFWAVTPDSPYVFEVPTFRADRVAPEGGG